VGAQEAAGDDPGGGADDDGGLAGVLGLQTPRSVEARERDPNTAVGWLRARTGERHAGQADPDEGQGAPTGERRHGPADAPRPRSESPRARRRRTTATAMRLSPTPDKGTSQGTESKTEVRNRKATAIDFVITRSPTPR